MNIYENIEIAGGDTATPLNLRNRLRIILEEINFVDKVFLDFGCGAGEYVANLLKMGIDAYGIEYNRDKVDNFKRVYPMYENRVRQGDIEKVDLKSNSIDVVLMNEVLEHVPQQNQALKEAFRILKPGGSFLIFSPNRLYPFETHGVKIKATQKNLPIYIPFIPYIPLRMGTRFLDYWARNYWPWELRKMIEDNGFKIVKNRFLWPTLENISEGNPVSFKNLIHRYRNYRRPWRKFQSFVLLEFRN